MNNIIDAGRRIDGWIDGSDDRVDTLFLVTAAVVVVV
jgi:hypothetical protein